MKSTSIIRFVLFLTLFTLALDAEAYRTKKTDVPDFAYPETVSKQAESRLNEALKTNNDLDAVRAVMDYALAQTDIGSTNTPAAIERIKQTRDKLSSEQCKSLLSLLLANVYCTVFNANSYVYNNRAIPLSPLSDDYTEWSGDQFRSVVRALCDEALRPEAALKSSPLIDYRKVITIEKPSAVYFPTLYDFIAHSTINLYEQMSAFSTPMSIVALSPRSIFMVSPGRTASAFSNDVLEIYASLLSFHRNDPAAEIYCDIQRIRFVAGNIYANQNADARKRAYEMLLNLYNDYSSSEYSGDALIAANDYSSDEAALYPMLTNFKKHFPNFARIGCIDRIISNITKGNVELKMPEIVAPNRQFEIKVKSSNVTDIYVDIYRRPEAEMVNRFNREFDYKKLKPISTVHLTLDKAIPFTVDTAVSVTVPDYGIYAAIPRAPQVKAKVFANGMFTATNLALGFIDFENTYDGVAFDPLTGCPVDKVDIIFRESPEKKGLNIGVTDSDGFVELPRNKNGFIWPVKGNDKYTYNYIYSNNYNHRNPTNNGNVCTDLSVYHPGDSVRWSAIVYEVENMQRRLVTDQKIVARMYNVNRQLVDSAEITTDDWGCIDGRFYIPKGDLTGSYSIYLSRSGNDFAYHSFMVSDYKLPTYFVSADKPAFDQPKAGDVTIKGVVKTYSGVGLSGIPVSAVVSASQWSGWFRTNFIDFAHLSDTTDVSGHFSLVLTKTMIENSPAPNGLMSADISAISLSGESQHTVARFAIGKAYSISTSLPSIIENSKPIDLDKQMKVESSDGTKVTTDLAYNLIDNKGKAVVSAAAVTDRVDWSKLPAATYTLEVFATELKTDTLSTNVILYRTDGKTSPVGEPIWTPDKKLVAEDGKKCNANIFASVGDIHCLMTISDDTTVYKKKWLKLHKGSNKVQLKLPNGVKTAKANFVATYNYATSSAQIDFEIRNAVPTLKILTESFRDKLQPGQRETWTFRTIGNDSIGTRSALIFDMYNQALDNIRSHNMQLSFNRGYFRSGNVTMGYLQSTSYNTLFEQLKETNCSLIIDPMFQTYGYSFAPVSKHRFLLRSAAVNNLAATSPEIAEADRIVNDEIIEVAEPTAPMAKSAEQADGGAEQKAEETQPFEYRNSDVVLAFFEPKLRTDASGNLTYSFTVPNANTTWNFTALAYDRNFATDILRRQAVANKPLMVQPNLPRYLRLGDRVTIVSTIINNSTESARVEALIELFDIVSGKVLADTTVAGIELAPEAQKAIDYNVDVPTDGSFLGFRIKVSDGSFADGEQAFIPLLPASEPVIESTPFYISPDSTRFEMQLPDFGSQSQVTLQYCDNPVWYVVTALPGISKEEAHSAPQAAAAIFSTAVADGIMRSNPTISAALESWTKSDKSDSTLVSMLQRNADLKTFLLKATPWMLDARNDTERMQRLALLFDKSNIAESYDKNIALLKKLQRPSGGWSWMGQYKEASEWATYQTLSILGKLNGLGFMPADRDLASMTKKALEYYQSVTEKSYKKHPSIDRTAYVMLLDSWPAFKPSLTSQRIISATAQKKVSGWKKMTLLGKSESALILERHGYHRVALQILESLRQYAKSSPSKGMWWPLLDDFASGTMTELALATRNLKAFALVSPGCKEIDLIRQWLILQKEARDWGNSSTASDVAAAILTTSQKWIEPAQPATIAVGDKPVESTAADNTLGYLRTDITAMSPSNATLTIEKTDTTPAWGAVYSRSTRKMGTIEAVGCEDVTIEKNVYKQVGDTWVTADEIRVGDKLRIELLLHVNRAMDYVAIDDDRAACFEPVEQLPAPIVSEGIYFYRENNDDATNIFIDHLPKGTYRLSYDVWTNNAGEFASGIATIQSQYAPQLTAHSAGTTINVAPAK